MNITRSLVPATVAFTAILVATGAPAMAKGKDGRVTASGSCSSSGTWKVKASPEDGRLEVEAEVDTNVNGQSWTWSLKQNGSTIATGTRSTLAPSGSFEVRKVAADKAGVDTFAFTARRNGSTQVCSGVVKI